MKKLIAKNINEKSIEWKSIKEALKILRPPQK